MLIQMKLRMSNKVGEGFRGWSDFKAKEGLVCQRARKQTSSVVNKCESKKNESPVEVIELSN